MTGGNEIWTRAGQIDRDRRKFMEAAMKDYDRDVYHPARRQLIEECGKIGHNMKFQHLGPLGDPWFSCTHCRASECRVGE